MMTLNSKRTARRCSAQSGDGALRMLMRFRKKTLFFLLIIAFVALTVWLATVEVEGALREFVLQYGYAGFFVAAFVGGFNLIVPISHIVFVIPLLNIGLNPWMLIVLGAVGATLADGVGYGVGWTGGSAFPKILTRFRAWAKRTVTKRPYLAPVILFGWASLVPLPNEVLVIPAGVVRYGFFRTLFITFAGNIIFNILAVQFGGLFVAG